MAIFDLHSLPIGVYFPLPDDDPHYAAAGRVASAWSILELYLDKAIAELLEVPVRRCACLTAQMLGPVPRLNAIISLVQSRAASKTLITNLNKFLNDTHPLADKRNRIVHDPLLLEVRSKTPSQLTVTAKGAKGKLRYEYKPIDIKHMDDTLNEIRKHTDRFLLIKKKIDGELFPSKHKRR